MGKIGLVFPGQGSQFVGMGRDLYERHEIVRHVFDLAREILGTDILSICLDGPKELLDQTINTQLAVLTFEIAALEAMRKLDILEPDVAAGHSLGEYSAVYASGALGLEDVLALVRARAMRHEEAVPPGTGAMAAVVGLTGALMEQLVRSCSAEGEPVDLANLNAPNQMVVSGHTRAVERLMEQAKERGAKLVVRLPISAPCHSRLLAGASARFARDLERVRFNAFRIPVIPNCVPDILYSPENARKLMSRQIVSPVRWQETIEKMALMGVDTIVEVGPKRILSGLIKNIRKDIRLHWVGDAESLSRLGELARAA